MAQEALKGAVLTGRSVTKYGYTRNWNGAKATGKSFKTKDGRTLIQVATPKGKRMINEGTFTGLIKAGKTEQFFSGGRPVKSASNKVRNVLADVVLGKGNNVKVAEAKVS
jgi:imidazolonepropionase-like amidohydrolase